MSEIKLESEEMDKKYPHLFYKVQSLDFQILNNLIST